MNFDDYPDLSDLTLTDCLNLSSGSCHDADVFRYHLDLFFYEVDDEDVGGDTGDFALLYPYGG